MTAAPRAGARLMVVHGDPKKLKNITQILRSVSHDVEGRERLCQFEGVAGHDLLLIDYDGLDAEERDLLVERYRSEDRPTRLLLVSGGECRKDFVKLFGNRMLTNLLGKDDYLHPEELIVTVQKLLRGDIFGMKKYFTWGIVPRVLTFRASSEKEVLTRLAHDYATSIGTHGRLAALYCNVADEFLTNAIYNAPVDTRGVNRYAHLSRESEVTLEDGEEITVMFGSDGHRLGISVGDPFGSLTQERLLTYLSKCYRNGEDQVDEKKGGAGLGFYNIFESLSHFVVNISPGVRTEMIGIIDVRGSYKDFAVRNKSFNIFIGE